MTDRATPDESVLWRKRIAAEANDRAWALAESTTRTSEDDEDMLQAAHAAMYLWKLVGTESNRNHAAQLVAHVHALLGQAEPARRYLARSLPFFLEQPAAPWEHALAHAVAAAVAAASGDAAAHAQHLQTAMDLTAALEDADDRAIIEATLKVVPNEL